MGVPEKNREKPSLGLNQMEKNPKNGRSIGPRRKSTKQLTTSQGEKIISEGIVRLLEYFSRLMMIVQTWNIMGLNKKSHQYVVGRLLENTKSDFLLLQESKMILASMAQTINKI